MEQKEKKRNYYDTDNYRVFFIFLVFVGLICAVIGVIDHYLGNKDDEPEEMASVIEIPETPPATNYDMIKDIPVNGTHNGHKYVNLGLSVLWATCDVGSSKPDRSGTLYGWGELTSDDKTGSWDDYRFREKDNRKGSIRLTKYVTSSFHGTVDNLIYLDLSDDIAAVKWGEGWRMPTKNELKELVDSCEWVWTTINSTNGYLVKSKKTAGSIFLPAGGYEKGERFYGVNSCAYYYSNQLNTANTTKAYCLYFKSDIVSITNKERYYQFTIRPVCPPSSLPL